MTTTYRTEFPFYFPAWFVPERETAPVRTLTPARRETPVREQDPT